jgi:DNA-binding response OmpR family regulator
VREWSQADRGGLGPRPEKDNRGASIWARTIMRQAVAVGELLARIRAALRRSASVAQDGSDVAALQQG